MGAYENKQSAEDAYEAFGKGDAEGAMRNMDDSVEWTVRGDNALTGTYNGKQAVGELWAQFGSKDFRTEPHDFIADGDKVVVLTTIHLEGETVESADILTYNGGGKLVAFDTRADARWPTGCSQSRSHAGPSCHAQEGPAGSATAAGRSRPLVPPGALLVAGLELAIGSALVRSPVSSPRARPSTSERPEVRRL